MKRDLIPLHRGDLPAAAAARIEAAGQPRARILVVDDTEDNLFMMTGLLEDQYQIQTATSGEQALQIIMSQTPPDLILLDIMMPDMDGYEVLRRIRQHPVAGVIPVIFLTALSTVEEEQLGLDMGAVDYITKPISPPLMLTRVHTHLERSSNARRLQSLSEKLSRYLAPQVYQSLFDGTRSAEIRTERKKLTVFFSDIKDFTATTATWQPEDITRLLNGYFSEMSRIAAEFGGTVDKFIGDAMVIFFGDPESRGVREDALQCVKMAMAMQRRMKCLQDLWHDVGPSKSFRIRIGINTGYCNVGNFGCDTRMEYTIIGPEVNLAARLEQAAEPGGILVAEATCALIRDEINFGTSVSVRAKGFTEELMACSVVDIPDSIDGVKPDVERDMRSVRALLDQIHLPNSDLAAVAQKLRCLADRMAA